MYQESYSGRPSGDQAGGDAGLRFSHLVLSPATRTVAIKERVARLTAKEFDLLHFLASHPGQVFTREQLMVKVWEYAEPIGCSTVTVHVRRLREKVEIDPDRPEHIKTVWGVGYKFQA